MDDIKSIVIECSNFDKILPKDTILEDAIISLLKWANQNDKPVYIKDPASGKISARLKLKIPNGNKPAFIIDQAGNYSMLYKLEVSIEKIK